ncbi:hypothetical protein D3C77_314870 [compost metagenome]
MADIPLNQLLKRSFILRRQSENMRLSVIASRCLRQRIHILFHNDVTIGAAEAEGAHTAAQRLPGIIEGCKLRIDVERRLLQINVVVRRPEVNKRRVLTMLQHQY